MNPISHPDLTYANQTVCDALNACPQVSNFVDLVLAILAKKNRYEKVEVCWWHEPYLYIIVRDTRWKHYPCNMRFLITFDTATGEVAHQKTTFARKGWGEFARQHVDKVKLYSECNEREADHC